MDKHSGANQAVNAPEDTNTQSTPNPGGNALLNAEAQLSGQARGGAAMDAPAATNFNASSGDPSQEKGFTTTGAYPADQTRLNKDYDTPPSLTHQDEVVDDPAAQDGESARERDIRL